MIEPCGYGAAVCFGPNTGNFKDVVRSLLACNAAKVVKDQAELTELMRNWLVDRESAIRQGTAAREFVVGQSGASSRTIDLLLDPKSSVHTPAAA